jgi:dihydroorotase
MGANKPILIRGGSVASEDSSELRVQDVLVENGMITQLGSGLNAAGAEVIDASGKIILPGLFDMNVHLREPGRSDQESIKSGTEAAINGGITGVVAMPDCSPAVDNTGMVRTVIDIAHRDSRIAVFPTGCITKGRAGEEMASIGGMVEAGAVMITDGGRPVANPQMLRHAMEYAREFDLPVASHCEVNELSGKGAMNEGKISYKLGIPGMPAIAEEICIDRDIRIGRFTGCHLHIQHVSTAAGLETIRRYKNEGVKVTCEVSPHHLIFNENDIVDYDTHFKMNPPLRTVEDNEALLQGLLDGTIDFIATGHAPHTEFEKQQQDFTSAPFGITGLETALPSLFHYFIASGKFGWDLLVKRFSAEPRRFLKKDVIAVAEGSAAELVIFDPQGETTFTREFIKSKSVNTPFLNMTLKGRVERVLL